MKKALALAGMAWAVGTQAAAADEPAPDADERGAIVVTGLRTEGFAGTKTETPLIETPQPITVITEDIFRAQGAISVGDITRYAAGVLGNAYGRDTRVDSISVRGIEAVQFRDGMRDIFSSYASIAADPYNFSRVEIVRGPASVLFGQGSIGGLVNLVSKTPTFETGGEAGLTYGSYNRKEAFADVNAALSDTFAVRVVGRVRDADTFVDHVPDDRVFVAPSIRWQPTDKTDITLLGLYQEDDGGSTAQFLPIIGTFRDNPGNPRLPRYLFVGKPGWDRYDGRLLQGGAQIDHRFSDAIKLSLKARYIDSDVTYFTHYTNSYSNPTNPYLDPARRKIGLIASGSYATLNVFSTDNNLQFKFNTGDQIEHLVLAGVDYSWNRVGRRDARISQEIDLYDIDRAALIVPSPDQFSPREVVSQKQLGFYLQDQIRFWDRVSVVLGIRRDRVRTASAAINTVDKATTFRAGIIGEIGAGISPFFSYTESFQPLADTNSEGIPFKPQRGVQFEAGVKWQPDRNTLVTVTGFHIKENNRPIADPLNPLERIQSGELTTKGFEVEASRALPGNFDISVNYGYNKLVVKDTTKVFDYFPRHTASIWSTKTFAMNADASLRLGAGVRYTGKRKSVGDAWTIITKESAQVDALAEILWRDWRFSVNATNLLNAKLYASCLARGDCFLEAPRNVMATIGYRF